MSGIASNKGKNNDKLLKTFNNLKNLKCTFCTGKGYRGGYQTLKNVNMELPFICENGSLIITKDGEVVYNDCMNFNEVKNLIYDISKVPYEFLAYVDLNTHKYKFLRGSKRLTEDLTQPWFHSEEIYNDIDQFLNNIDKDNICRITTRGLDLDKNSKIFSNFNVAVSEKEFHSICNKEIGKGSGVKKLAQLYNVDLKDIIIIGNDLNDVDMFKINCGWKIATGICNPPKELLDLSDVYVPIDELSDYIIKIDREEIS